MITQRVHGTEIALLHAGGTIIEQELSAGEEFHLETGTLVAWEEHMALEIKWITSVKNLLFAHDGIALTKIRGPDRIYIRRLPSPKMVTRIDAELPEPKPQK